MIPPKKGGDNSFQKESLVEADEEEKESVLTKRFHGFSFRKKNGLSKASAVVVDRLRESNHPKQSIIAVIMVTKRKNRLSKSKSKSAIILGSFHKEPTKSMGILKKPQRNAIQGKFNSIQFDWIRFNSIQLHQARTERNEQPKNLTPGLLICTLLKNEKEVVLLVDAAGRKGDV